MSHLPTLIVLATTAMPEGQAGLRDPALRPALPDFQQIAQTLDLAQDAGLPVVLAASRWVKQQCEVFAPDVTCLEADGLHAAGSTGSSWVRAAAQAVQACSHASGWLVMPAPMADLLPSTLHQLCQALRQAPLVRPTYQMQAGYPLGFSGEFYSELVRLQTEDQLRRMLVRYPSATIDTDDAAVCWGGAGTPGWPGASQAARRGWPG